MAAKLLDEAIEQLVQAGASMRCAELGKLLEGLGFEVRDGRRGGHRVFVHDHLSSFCSSSYNCDHGRNPQIKRPYLTKVLRILREHYDELSTYLEKRHD